MHRIHLALLLLLPAALTACTGIARVRSDLPRVEAEVVFRSEPAFFQELAPGVDRDAVHRTARAGAEPLADVGLRFYATPTETYGEGQRRPEYLLTFQFTGLAARRVLERGGDGEVARARLEDVTATVSVRVERRRPDGPPLHVGTTEGTGSAVRRSDDPGPGFALVKVAEEGNDVEVTEAMVRAAVGTAARHALSRLQVAIDRELALQGASR